MDALNRVCNVKLPWNTISTTMVREGMVITRPYDPTRAVHTVKAVRGGGMKLLFTTEGGERIWCTSAGTLRLVTTPDKYDYHAGHGCLAEGAGLRDIEFLQATEAHTFSV